MDIDSSKAGKFKRSAFVFTLQWLCFFFDYFIFFHSTNESLTTVDPTEGNHTSGGIVACVTKFVRYDG